MDLFSSLLCGLVIFAILGHMSHALGVPLENVVGQGNKIHTNTNVPESWQSFYMNLQTKIQSAIITGEKSLFNKQYLKT